MGSHIVWAQIAKHSNSIELYCEPLRPVPPVRNTCGLGLRNRPVSEIKKSAGVATRQRHHSCYESLLMWVFKSPTKPCTCAPGIVTKYQKRVSGPIPARIDILMR